MIQHALDRGYQVVGVCSRDAIRRAVEGCRSLRLVDIDDQIEACDRIFRSDTRWTVVRGSDLEEGESQSLPVWSSHVGDPILASNHKRRIAFALFMIDALTNDELVEQAPAIVSSQSESALRHGLGGAPPAALV